MNVAVVGCNRGIGLEIVRQMKDRGHKVYAFCRNSSPELEKISPEKIISGFEVTDTENMLRLVKDSGLSDIDQYYHVAGIMRSTSLENFDVNLINEEFLVNAVAPIVTAKVFLPFLKKGSKLGLVTSRMGSIADNTSGGYYGYRMSKTALNSAGKSLAEDIKSQEVAVFLLHPGWVKTDMTGHTGHVDTKESAEGLINIMNSKSIDETGSFWHMNGEPLPW